MLFVPKIGHENKWIVVQHIICRYEKSRRYSSKIVTVFQMKQQKVVSVANDISPYPVLLLAFYAGYLYRRNTPPLSFDVHIFVLDSTPCMSIHDISMVRSYPL